MSAAIAALLCLHGQLAATESAVATAVAEAKQTLDDNWTGRNTVPAHGLYPHQWSW